jgi:hypothetical protein
MSDKCHERGAHKEHSFPMTQERKNLHHAGMLRHYHPATISRCSGWWAAIHRRLTRAVDNHIKKLEGRGIFERYDELVTVDHAQG